MNILVIFIMMLFLSPSGAVAASRVLSFSHAVNSNGINSIVGIIKGMSRNTIDFYDEENKIERSFIDTSSPGEFKVGDRVRLYYYVDTHVVQTLKKETPVLYKENGQNLGYISRVRVSGDVTIEMVNRKNF